VVNSRTLEILFDMQSEKVPCIRCNTITKTDVHIDNNNGLAVYTKYVCPRCKTEFMEKDLHEQTTDNN